MDDVSIRLGSHIHGSQQTVVQQGPAARAGVVQHESSLHSAYPGTASNWVRPYPSAGTRSMEAGETSGKDEEMFDTTELNYRTTCQQLVAEAHSDQISSSQQPFRDNGPREEILVKNCSNIGEESRLEIAYSPGEILSNIQPSLRLVKHTGTEQKLSEEEGTDCMLFRSSPPPIPHSESYYQMSTTVMAGKRHLPQNMILSSNGVSEETARPSENRFWTEYLDIPTSTIVTTAINGRPRNHQDEVYDNLPRQRSTRTSAQHGLDTSFDVEDNPNDRNLCEGALDIQELTHPVFSTAQKAQINEATATQGFKLNAAEEERLAPTISSTENEIWRNFIFGDLDDSDEGVSVEARQGDEELESTSETPSKPQNPTAEMTQPQHNINGASCSPSSMVVEPTRTPIGSSTASSIPLSRVSRMTEIPLSQLSDKGSELPSMLVEPSQHPEAFGFETSMSSSLIPQTSQRESDPDPATRYPPPSPSMLDPATSCYLSGLKTLFKKPASFVGRAVHAAGRQILSDSTGWFPANLVIGISLLLILVLVPGAISFSTSGKDEIEN